MMDRRTHNNFGAQNIGLYGFKRIKLTRRNLLQGRGMKYEIDTCHRMIDTAVISNITDIKL